MTTPDKLSIEEIEDIIRHPAVGCVYDSDDFIPVCKQLADTMRENERLREALEEIAEEHDAGRYDGLPEPCPAHDDLHMWFLARAALGETK